MAKKKAKNPKGRPKVSYTEPQIAEAYLAYLKTGSYMDAADYVGVANTRISYLMRKGRKLGLVPSKIDCRRILLLGESWRDKVIEAARTAKSFTEICSKLGIDIHSLRRNFNDLIPEFETLRKRRLSDNSKSTLIEYSELCKEVGFSPNRSWLHANCPGLEDRINSNVGWDNVPGLPRSYNKRWHKKIRFSPTVPTAEMIIDDILRNEPRGLPLAEIINRIQAAGYTFGEKYIGLVVYRKTREKTLLRKGTRTHYRFSLPRKRKYAE